MKTISAILILCSIGFGHCGWEEPIKNWPQADANDVTNIEKLVTTVLGLRNSSSTISVSVIYRFGNEIAGAIQTSGGFLVVLATNPRLKSYTMRFVSTEFKDNVDLEPILENLVRFCKGFAGIKTTDAFLTVKYNLTKADLSDDATTQAYYQSALAVGEEQWQKPQLSDITGDRICKFPGAVTIALTIENAGLYEKGTVEIEVIGERIDGSSNLPKNRRVVINFGRANISLNGKLLVMAPFTLKLSNSGKTLP